MQQMRRKEVIKAMDTTVTTMTAEPAATVRIEVMIHTEGTVHTDKEVMIHTEGTVHTDIEDTAIVPHMFLILLKEYGLQDVQKEYGLHHAMNTFADHAEHL